MASLFYSVVVFLTFKFSGMAFGMSDFFSYYLNSLMMYITISVSITIADLLIRMNFKEQMLDDELQDIEEEEEEYES